DFQNPCRRHGLECPSPYFEGFLYRQRRQKIQVKGRSLGSDGDRRGELSLEPADAGHELLLCAHRLGRGARDRLQRR
ncbi:hypothetical protein ABTB90_19375, partial [Acinetobacter baumannii]